MGGGGGGGGREYEAIHGAIKRWVVESGKETSYVRGQRPIGRQLHSVSFAGGMV